MNSELLQGFYLGDLLIEPLKGQVTGRAGSQHLPPKAVEVLLCLAQQPGKLVERDAILDKVWGAGNGSREALGHAVSEVRHALGDHPDDPRFIQTLPKRGYRLILTPVPVAEHSDSIILGTQNGARPSDIGFLENLQRRGVFETALAYLIVGWLLIQIADIVFAQLYLPEWTATFVTVLVIAGFPLALALSWYLEFRDGKAVLEDMSPLGQRRRRFSRTYVAIVGALGLAAVLVFLYDQSIGLPGAGAPEDIESPVLPPVLANSIAVLPFFNVDGGEETQIFANGLADDLIDELSRVPGLLVSSRGDSSTLAPNSASARVRERLRVAYYLEGSVQIAEEKLRIIVQLIDSATGFHVLSRRFDREREDFFDIRNEITELTVANIRVSLPAEMQAPVGPHTDEPTLNAYVLYRRGVDAANAPTTILSIEEALSWFDAVLEIDPDYAAAHAGKCRVFVDAYPETDDPNYMRDAHASCALAIELNPNLDVVHTALGHLFDETGHYDRAEKSFLEALRINPNSVEALIGIGETYVVQGRLEEAETSFRQAIGRHPGDWSAYNMLGWFLYNSGRFAEAARELSKVVALDSSNARGYSNLGTALLFAGEFEAAVAALESAIELEPRANTYSSLGLLHYYLGNRDEAVDKHRIAVELAPDDHFFWLNFGDALWYAGKSDDSRVAFERAEALVASALTVNPNDPNFFLDLAWISAMLDKPGKAIDLIERARELIAEDPSVHYIEGLILLRQGDTAAALAALGTAAEKGYSLKIMAAEPHLEELRNLSEFRAIVSTNP